MCLPQAPQEILTELKTGISTLNLPAHYKKAHQFNAGEDEIVFFITVAVLYCTYFISVLISVTMYFLSLTMSSKFLPVAFVCKIATKLKSKQIFVKNVRIFRQFVHKFFFSILNIQFPSTNRGGMTIMTILLENSFQAKSVHHYFPLEKMNGFLMCAS